MTVLLCSTPVVELKPATVVSSRLITWIGDTELKVSRAMREPVTVTCSRLVACCLLDSAVFVSSSSDVDWASCASAWPANGTIMAASKAALRRWRVGAYDCFIACSPLEQWLRCRLPQWSRS